jgi:tetratricopeptide (TPR) repeat protein
MKKAIALETDHQTKASMAMQLRQIYADHARIPEAIAEAEVYVREGAEVSTYLRDRKDDARMFIACRKALQGEREQLEIIHRIVQQKPQNYAYAVSYADALAANGDRAQAIERMQNVQRIFLSNRSRRPDFDLRIAECFYDEGQPDSARTYYIYCKDAEARLTPDDAQRLYRLSLQLDTGDSIPPVDARYPTHSIAYIASCRFTQGLQREKAGDRPAAIRLYTEALTLNPYLTQAKEALRRNER